LKKRDTFRTPSFTGGRQKGIHTAKNTIPLFPLSPRGILGGGILFTRGDLREDDPPSPGTNFGNDNPILKKGD